MVDERKVFGHGAEAFVESVLVNKGYRIVARQFRTRHGEIDLIALDGDEVVFVEVKARRSRASGDPEEAVGLRKIRHIESVGEAWLEQSGRVDDPWRIDVVAVVTGEEGIEVEHFEDVDTAGLSW